MRLRGHVAVGLVVTVALFVAYDRQVTAPRERLLSQTRTRLADASRHIDAARLDAAESLIFQAVVDLTTVDTWYALPSLRHQASELRSEAAAARVSARRRGESIETWLQAEASLVRRGDIAQALLGATAPRAPLPVDDGRLLAFVRLVRLLAALDFEGAEQTLATASLTVSWNGELRTLVDNCRNQAVEAWLGTVLDLARKGDFPRAAALAGSERAPLPASDGRRQAVCHLVGRLAVQDFAGAEQALGQVTPSGTGTLGETFQQLIASEREANHQKQAIIAANVKPLISNVVPSQEFKPVLQGRAMVWDFTKDDVENAYELLPDDLRASSRDGLITIFCVTKRRNEVVGHYSISGQPAYREHMTVAVVYWPDKVAAGSTVIAGGEPVSLRVVKHTPEYGSSVKIKEWIERLPRAEDHDGQSVRTAGPSGAFLDQTQRPTAPSGAESSQKGQATHSLYRDVSGWPERGQVAKARDAIAQARSTTSDVIPEPVVLAMSRFVNCMVVNDFVGAEAALGSLPLTSIAGNQIETETAALLRVVSAGRQAVHADGAWIAERVKALVSDRTRKLRGRPPLRGRAVVWDLTEGDVEKAYELLPDDLRARSRAGLLTVFCVTERRNEVGGGLRAIATLSGQRGDHRW